MRAQGKRCISILLAVILTLQFGITVFADGSGTETPIITPSDVDIYGVSIVLNGEIGLTFHVKVKRQYWGGTMELKFEKKENAVPTLMNIKDCPSEGLNLYTATYYLSAIELSEPVMLTVFDANGKALAQKSCSAAEYVALLDKDEEATESEKNIGKTLINYGHYAQLACSEENGWVIGEDFAETTAFYEPTVDKSVFDDYAAVWQKRTDEVYCYSMSLLLDYKTRMTLSFYTEEKPTVTVNGEETEAVPSERLEGCYEIEIGGINVLNLEDEYEIDVNGAVFTVSAFTYCYLASNKTAKNPDTFDAMRALYEFYQATVDYNEF